MVDSNGQSGPPGRAFGLLGPLVATSNGRPLRLGGPRQRAVLAMLLLQADRVVSRDALVRGVWGDEPPSTAVQTLQTYVFHLRQELEPDRPAGTAARLLATAEPGYVLRTDFALTDAGQFQAALAAGHAARAAGDPSEASRQFELALRLWRGPVLADIADYPFVAPEAARLNGLRLSAVEAKLDADLAQGRNESVAAECELWIAREPLRERLRMLSMIALYRAGRQAEALAGYQRARSTLAEELGVDPGPDLERLYHSVLVQDPSLNLPAPVRPALSIPKPTMPAATTVQTTPPAPSAPLLRETRSSENATGAERHRRSSGRWARVVAVAACVALTLLTIGVLGSSTGRPEAGGVVHPQPNTVAVLDAASGTMLRDVRVGTDPNQIAPGAGAVWVTNRQDGTVSRIDPRTLAVVQTIDVGPGPIGVSVGAGYVWVANSGAGTISQIDPESNRVVRTITVGNGPVAVYASSTAVWVANKFDDTVWRLDPSTARTVAKVSVGHFPTALAGAGDLVWVANSGAATGSQIDTRTSRVTGVVNVGGGPEAVVAATDAVWVANGLDGTVSRFDASRGVVDAVTETGDGPVDVAVGGTGVWVANQFSDSLTLLDQRTGHILRRVALTGVPRAVATVGNQVWVAIGAAGAGTHRGGTLRVVDQIGLGDNDPAVAYGPMMPYLYDGLVALRKVGGANGLTLVPDLAVSLPRPTNGGLEYAFRVRRGIRYSDGRVVRPSDIRRGLERSLQVPVNGWYYRGILGAPACLAAPNPLTCDLSRGVQADDVSYRLTIHLTAPDPDFLAKLALPFANATAPGALPPGKQKDPLPSTGAYRVADILNDRLLALTRNPYFRQWSQAAQPDGFPDKIVFTSNRTLSVAGVEAGRADVVWGGGDPTLLVRHRSRVHLTPSAGSFGMFLNVTTPPFDDIRVRRAVNYAVDRAAVARHWGAPLDGQVSCQVLPPSFPGYQPYCPYTKSPGAVWSAPDLDRAKALIRASGTAGQSITVWSPSWLRELADPIVPLLKQLGYRASLRILDEPYFSFTESRGSRAQIGVYAWAADFASAANYLQVMFSCQGDHNASRLCDRSVDSDVRRATALDGTDPVAAGLLWARIERKIMDLAPVLPEVIGAHASFLSARVGNYLDNPLTGVLYTQMWVR